MTTRNVAAPSEPLRTISEADLLRLLTRFAETRGDRGFTTEEATDVASWGNESRTMNAMLDAVLGGAIGIDVHEGGEILFLAKEAACPSRR